ncbi:MAG: hypothetical protein HYS12_10905 [Planctomycetes bacterium]|nr:hypothetical protein [Planctomycetota bacterium]
MKSAIRYVLFPALALGLLLAATAYAQDQKKKDEKKTEDKKSDDKKGGDKKEPPKEAATDYYPLKEGMTWNYKANDKKVTVSVAGFDKKGDPAVSCARLVTSERKPAGEKNELIATEYVAVKEDGVYRYAFEGTEAKPPLRFLKLPVDSANKKWSFESKVGSADVKGTFTLAKEKNPVKVPAGEYKDVVSVTSEGLEIDKQKVAITYYFAAKVGMIRQVVDIGGTKVTIELEGFEEKK